MKQQNKESKNRTRVNKHKLEWFKQFRQMEAREKALDEELKQFMLSNPTILKEKRKQMGMTTSTIQ